MKSTSKQLAAMTPVFSPVQSLLSMQWLPSLSWITTSAIKRKIYNMQISITQKVIGVIGYGNFGEVVCNNLFPKNNIILYARHPEGKKISKNVSVVSNIQDLVQKSDI